MANLRSTRFVLVCALLVSSVAGCKAKQDNENADEWLRLTRPSLQPCTPNRGGASDEHISIPVRLSIGVGANPEFARTQFREVVTLLASLNIDFRSVEGTVRQSPIATPFPLAKGPILAEQLVDRLAVPFTGLLETYSVSNAPEGEGIGALHFIFLEEVIPEGSSVAEFVDINALSLSPLDSGDHELSALLAALDIQEFQPTIVISERNLKGLSPVLRAQTIVHEFGHAMGLGHADDDSNLMAKSWTGTCAPAFSPAQSATLALIAARLGER